MTAELFTVEWSALPEMVRREGAWWADIEGQQVRLTNLDKTFWPDEGYTKGDVIAYYLTVADAVLPYVRDRPLTMKRMPNGATGEFFYEKQAPSHTPPWIRTAPVVAIRSGARIDYVVATNAASLAWLANLGCIELHPWHSRVQSLGAPDYAFFDLDPFGVDFPVVRDVALHVNAILEQLGLRGYPRTSGATGMQVYVPLDPIHDYGDVRAWVERCCALINRADPKRTTMAWDVSRRDGRVFLDHNMNVEGKNIAATWSLRPEPHAPVATPLRWDEVAEDVWPQDFTIRTVHREMAQRGELFAPVLAGGQDLREASAMLGLPPLGPITPHHRIAEEDEAPLAKEGARGEGERQRAGGRGSGDLRRYAAMRDFERTPEPSGAATVESAPDGAERFVIQHHLATRLHHDLRLERGGTLRSWALPKGLPLVRHERHLAVQTEDHPLEYLDFSSDIPAGEYGAGPMRIWDRGDYDVREWTDDKVTFRLHGRRHRGAWHLFRTSDADRSQWMVTRVDEGVDVPPEPATYTPMLAVLRVDPFDDERWLFEVKWDGVRAIATVSRPGLGRPSGTFLRSRRGNDVTVTYPELAGLWERVLAFNAVLDGEIVTFTPDGRPSFERLQRRMNIRDEHMARRMSSEMPVSYVVFDLLAVDGEELIALPLSERLQRLDEILVPGGPMMRNDTLGSSGTSVFSAVRDARLEGIIGKRLSSPYRPGKRSSDWVKIKVRSKIDCVIGGWLPKADEPHGSEPYSLLTGLWSGSELVWVARVGSGLTDAERATLAKRFATIASDECPFAPNEDLPPGAHWVRPETVCTVEYTEVTDAQRLRAPTYLGRRDDADPQQCLLSDLP
jgi:bifunctional non-homologous end joining protein LigD